jgi:hypothetical protein
MQPASGCFVWPARKRIGVVGRFEGLARGRVIVARTRVGWPAYSYAFRFPWTDSEEEEEEKKN